MTREDAKRKYDALRKMTVDRGCSKHEAATAARLAEQLARKWGFTGAPAADNFRPNFDDRFSRAESRAARRHGWEYRRCGKTNCWCSATSKGGHGPYKYAKQRHGRKVVSIYIGR
jgi:hypothetical protein